MGSRRAPCLYGRWPRGPPRDGGKKPRVQDDIATIWDLLMPRGALGRRHQLGRKSMKRTMGALALSTILLAGAGACSKKEEPVATPVTVAAGATTTVAAAGGSTTTTKGEATTSTKKKEATTSTTDQDDSTTTSKKDRATTTTRAGGSKSPRAKNIDLTEEENDCIATILVSAAIEDPSVVANDATTAGAVGAAVVQCVSKPRIGDAIQDYWAKNTGATASELACIRDETIAADDESLAIFVGVVFYAEDSGDSTLIEPFDEALKTACKGK